ncbi:MAG TPA: DinB family protein [Thermoanaerobaculia bacterium]|nr:DinB family protein [Thermoanaerobaculia bacterium]
MSGHRKEAFLRTSDREHKTTMRVLRAYPPDKLDMRPSERSNTARGLAWTFVLERGLGRKVWHDGFADGVPPSKPADPPESWDELLDALEKSHAEFRALVAGASDDDLDVKVHFFTAPKTMGEISRHEFIWFLLHDEIHHRGQFSVYLRLAGAKVPSIYGPSADEPWM